MIRLKQLLTEANDIESTSGEYSQITKGRHIYYPDTRTVVPVKGKKIVFMTSVAFIDYKGTGAIINASIKLNTNTGLEQIPWFDQFPISTPGSNQQNKLAQFKNLDAWLRQRRNLGLLTVGKINNYSVNQQDRSTHWILEFGFNIVDPNLAKKTIESDNEFGTLTLTFKDKPGANTQTLIGSKTLVYSLKGNSSAWLRYEGEPNTGLDPDTARPN